MDIVIILLIILLYVGLPMWRKYTPKKYPYSGVPQEVLPPELKLPLEEPVRTREYHADKVQAPAAHHAGSSLPPVEEQGAWQGKLNNNLIINGVIFAEILQPPRAYRPFRGPLK